MKKNFRSSVPWLVILIGVWYLLVNLGLVSITPWQTFILYWPIFLIWYGIKNFVVGLRQSNVFFASSCTLIFWLGITFLGVYILLPRIGFNVIPISWSIVWPVIVILIGISYLFKDRIIMKIFRNEDDFWSKEYSSYNSIIGDFNRSGSGWVVEDTSLGFGLGDVKFDLTKAIVPDRHTKINISGGIGDVVIYLPEDLPFKTNCYTQLGEVNVLHESKSGAGNFISLETPDYLSATRKLDIHIRLKIGAIKIRRIG